MVRIMAATKKKHPAKVPRRPSRRSAPRRQQHFAALDDALRLALDDYFKLLAGGRTSKLHKTVIGRVEKTLLQHVLEFSGFHQSRATKLLGISRGTLHTKIRNYGIKIKKPRAADQRSGTKN